MAVADVEFEGRAAAASPASPAETAPARGPVWVAYLFVFSLLVPIDFAFGGVVLFPHRIVLLLFFVPFAIRLYLMRRAGPVLAADWFLLASALWAALALLANHPFSMALQPAGIFIIEFFGAYLLARVTIRSGEDFQKFVKVLFLIMCVLAVFAVHESVTRRSLLLHLIPGGASRELIDIRYGLKRAQTIFSHSIHFGIFASACLGLFWFAVRPRGLRWVGGLAVAVGTGFSLSSGAFMAFTMQALFIGWETILRTLRQRWRLFAALSVAAYVSIDLLSNRTPFHVLVSYATFNSSSAYNRILIWQFGTENVRDNPVFGLGLNLGEWVRPIWMGASIDNYWLLLTMQYGLPFFALFATGLYFLLRGIARAPLVDEADKRCRAAYLVTIGGLMIAGSTVHFWGAMMAFVMFLFGTGAWAASGGATRQQDAPAAPPPARLSPHTRQNQRHVRAPETARSPGLRRRR